MLHQPYSRRPALLDVGRELQQAGCDAALLLSYDSVHARGVSDDARSATHFQLRLADAGWRFERAKSGRIPMASWIGRAAPSNAGSWDLTVAEAAAAQRTLGLDAITTPSPELHGAQGRTQLREALEAARRGFRNRPSSDPPWFARLTLRDEWLADPQLRAQALNEISNMPDDLGVALHVRWRKTDPETDEELLRGLKHFALTLANDDRSLLLLRSGIIGWLSLAWGVAGFSAGLSRASWVDSWPGGGGAKPGQPKPPNVQWFFEAALLRRFRDSEHFALAAQAGYSTCTCSFCATLPSGAAWLPAAEQHALYSLGRLTAAISAVPAGQRRQAIAALIHQAQSSWQALVPSAPLSPRPRPVHLDTWLRVL